MKTGAALALAEQDLKQQEEQTAEMTRKRELLSRRFSGPSTAASASDEGQLVFCSIILSFKC